MKVSLQTDYKELYTIADLERAKTVIAYEKENDDSTPAQWAEYAVREALKGTDDGLVRIVEARATTCKNNRAHDSYTDNSGNLDVLIMAIAKTYDGFIEVGAYLTDIWQTGPEYNYRQNMWSEYYTNKK